MKVGEIIPETIWFPSRDYETTCPLISVLLPTFRRLVGGSFERCVDSILEQTVDSLELIIIDDCSTDGTFDRILQYQKEDARVSCIRHERNVGLPAISEYEGFLRARGQKIYFTFDDNYLYEDALARLAQSMESTGLKFVYANIILWVKSKNGMNKRILGTGELGMLQYINFIANASFLIDREILEKVGLYDPHLLMTRLCDWDLLVRIYKEYPMHHLDEIIGEEFGATLEDSLGKNYPLVWSAVVEWMKKPRNEMLKQEHYCDYDILLQEADCPEFVKDSMFQAHRYFSSKAWYYPNNHLTKLLVLTTGVGDDPSCHLYFNENSSLSSKITIMLKMMCKEEDLLDKQAVILVRNLYGMTDILRICEALEIPTYWFIDDNLVELGKTWQEYQRYAIREKLIKQMGRLSGVLTSTERLADYFRQNRIHSNVEVFPPLLQKPHLRPNPRGDGKVTLAFIGGRHRLDAFMEYVLPALRKLARSSTVRLITFGVSWAEKPSELEVVDLRVMPLAQLYSYLAFYEVEIILHPGEEAVNAEYKVPTALLAAHEVGSCVVASKCPPYSQVEKEAVILCENSTESWYEALHGLMNSPEKLAASQRTVIECCDAHFSQKANLEILHKIAESTDIPTRELLQLRRLNFEKYKAIQKRRTILKRTQRKIKKEIGRLLKKTVGIFVQPFKSFREFKSEKK